jgi:hypothetical protein
MRGERARGWEQAPRTTMTVRANPPAQRRATDPDQPPVRGGCQFFRVS